MLFEAISLIIHNDTEPNLLVRACNQLGQFLSNRETNLRYLALESMCLLATSEFSHEAVKKHQEVVILSMKVKSTLRENIVTCVSTACHFCMNLSYIHVQCYPISLVNWPYTKSFFQPKLCLQSLHHPSEVLLQSTTPSCEPGSSVSIATDYGLDGPRIEPWWGEIFRRPDWPWGPPSLLYNGYRIFPGDKVRLGRAASSAMVMEE